jgi:hypothetical protein
MMITTKRIGEILTKMVKMMMTLVAMITITIMVFHDRRGDSEEIKVLKKKYTYQPIWTWSRLVFWDPDSSEPDLYREPDNEVDGKASSSLKRKTPAHEKTQAASRRVAKAVQASQNKLFCENWTPHSPSDRAQSSTMQHLSQEVRQKRSRLRYPLPIFLMVSYAVSEMEEQQFDISCCVCSAHQTVCTICTENEITLVWF